MKAFKYLLLALLTTACSKLTKQREVVDIPEPATAMSLINKPSTGIYANVEFSNNGMRLDTINGASYVYLDSIAPIKDNYNISFWFKLESKDGKTNQTFFNAVNTNNKSNFLTFGLAGFRVAGILNSNVFSAKDFSKDGAMSRTYFDLPRLEVGKYYFFSVNVAAQQVQVFINAELYQQYELTKDYSLQANALLLGVRRTTGDYKNQFLGTLRNLEIYNHQLSENQIYSVSVKNFDEIAPLNDAFELSKFILED